MALTRLEAEIKASLAKLCENPEAPAWSNPDWTRAVKAAVGSAAEKGGHSWLSSDSVGAWLWDGTAHTRQDGNLLNIPLMLESEWGDWDAILYDFEKLLAARAAHRVMVCSASSQSRAEETLSRLTSIVQGFQASQGGDRYLLACWYGPAGTAGEFIFRSLVVGD